MKKKIGTILLAVLLAISCFVLWEDSSLPDNTQEDHGGQQSEQYVEYRFANDKLLKEHFENHGKEMGFKNKEDYQKAASDVVNDPKALTKTEKEDGDYVYYLEKTNEFVIVSKKTGYIRTYFYPARGIDYYYDQ